MHIMHLSLASCFLQLPTSQNSKLSLLMSECHFSRFPSWPQNFGVCCLLFAYVMYLTDIARPSEDKLLVQIHTIIHTIIHT